MTETFTVRAWRAETSAMLGQMGVVERNKFWEQAGGWQCKRIVLTPPRWWHYLILRPTWGVTVTWRR